MSMSSTSDQYELLDEISVLPYLAGRGVVSATHATAAVLAGGVSNVVLLVEDGQNRVVVKQALSRLRVADEWFADPARTEAEAAALRLTATLTPAAVPAVIDNDPARHTLTIQAAPRLWRNWKEHLLSGECMPEVARWLGTVLATWHEKTRDMALPVELDGVEAFHQLRLRPYFGVAATRRPDLAAELDTLQAQVLAHRSCLVSGDFSPKNVLVGPDGAWVIDLEVAHRGDPAFDVGFMLHHLVLKGLHLPAHRTALRRCCDAFLDAYGSAPGTADSEHLHTVTAGLLLARVVGSSPVDYLTPRAAAQVEAAAADLLREPARDFTALWRRVVGD